MDVFNFKCKYCGGELNEVEGLKSVGKCKYCGSKQTLPKLENEKRANLFERANHLRRNNEFDKAEALYEQLLNEDLTDPEAYWSLVLCRYGIEYVEDKRTGERLPTVNRMQMVSILADEDYKSAIANADAEQKVLYEEEAKLINEIQKGILEIARREEPFDIFICYKETDADGRRSRDSILAQDLYHELTRDGYKVFFARVTLQGKLGSAYEPYIFSALNSAKVMVVLGTQKEHFEAVWVRNEWSRFLGQIKKGERKVLIPAYRDMDAYDLPVEFSNLQALDMSRLGFLQELVEGVENILKAYKKKEAPKAEPAPAPTYAPPQNSAPEKKKKSKAPIVIIAMILALAIGGGALFMSGALDPIFGGGETELLTESPTEKITAAPTQDAPTEPIESDIPTETPTQEPYETEGESDTQSGSGESNTETELPTGDETQDESETQSGSGESDTELPTEDEIGDELRIEGAVSTLEEGKAYLGVLAHKNLGKLVYLTGTMYNEYYLAETDDIGSAENVYFEKSYENDGYHMYFMGRIGFDYDYDYPLYVNIRQDGAYLDISLDASPETVWNYNTTYNCLMANVSGELVFLGTSDTGTYENICVKRISEGATFFKMQFVISPDQPEQNQGLEFELNENGDAYTLVGVYEYTGAHVRVPETYKGLPVTCIGDFLSPDCEYIDSITIPSSITKIYNSSDMLRYINRVHITDIAKWCEIEFDLSGGLGHIFSGTELFFNGELITDLVIPDGVTSISDGAFSYCDISSLTIPDSVTRIGAHAFADCEALSEVTLGIGVSHIGNAAFSGCESLTTVTYAGTYEDFDKISIGESNSFFTGVEVECLTESEIAVNDPITTIEECKAYLGVLGHKNLKKYIYLNGALDGYYLGAVDSKDAAANVYFETSNGGDYYMFFYLPEEGTKTYVNLFLNGEYINFTLDNMPNTEWHYNATYKCPVANVEGELVFLGTSNTGTYGNFVPKRVGEIDGYFTMQLIDSPNNNGEAPLPEGKTSLEFVLDSATDSYRVVGFGSGVADKVVIPSTYNGKPVKFIGAHAFDGCIEITSLSIPKSIVHIDDYAFKNCINLVHITYEGSYEEWMEINTSIWGNDSLRNEGMKMVYRQVAADPEPENYDFSFVWAPDGESFYVAGLWEYADPTRVVIPETHKGIFVTGINDYAFQANNEIAELYIPATVSYIGENAFAECPNLSKVEFEGTAATWKGIHIGNGNDILKTADIYVEVVLDACQHKEVERESCFVYCMDCLKHVDTQHQGEEIIQPENGCKVVCSECGEDLGKVYHEDVKILDEMAPTETSEGYSKFECLKCGTIDTVILPPLGDSSGGQTTMVSVSDALGLMFVIDQINSGEYENDITIRLEDNIDMDGVEFTPIHEFRGTIDGNGKTISNITLTENGASVSVRDGNGSEYNAMAIGFIGKAYGVTVRDLTLDSVMADISTAQNIYIGALAGYADGIVIEDSTITSNLALKETGRAGTTGVAGVIGYSLDALMERVNVDATIDHTAQSGESHTGAILGAGNVRIHNCTIDLAVKFIGQSGAGHAGWLIGREYTDADVDCATLRDSTVTGTFEASDCMYAWGAVGQGYFYIEHGEQIDIYEHNAKIDVKEK